MDLKIPGFVTIYRDENGYVHLYFFPGIVDNHTEYNNIDITDIKIKYSYTKYIDGAIDYKFENKLVTKIFCKLIKTGTNKEIFETLTI